MGGENTFVSDFLGKERTSGIPARGAGCGCPRQGKGCDFPGKEKERLRYIPGRGGVKKIPVEGERVRVYEREKGCVTPRKGRFRYPWEGD